MDIEKKYFKTFDYKKFTEEILDARIKEKRFFEQSGISYLVKNSALNIKLATLPTNSNLKPGQDKTVEL